MPLLSSQKAPKTVHGTFRSNSSASIEINFFTLPTSIRQVFQSRLYGAPHPRREWHSYGSGQDVQVLRSWDCLHSPLRRLYDLMVHRTPRVLPLLDHPQHAVRFHTPPPPPASTPFTQTISMRLFVINRVSKNFSGGKPSGQSWRYWLNVWNLTHNGNYWSFSVIQDDAESWQQIEPDGVYSFQGWRSRVWKSIFVYVAGLVCC